MNISDDIKIEEKINITKIDEIKNSPLILCKKIIQSDYTDQINSELFHYETYFSETGLKCDFDISKYFSFYNSCFKWNDYGIVPMCEIPPKYYNKRNI